MNSYFKSIAVMAACISNVAYAVDEGWFLRPNLGFSNMSDLSAQVSDIDGTSGVAEVAIDSGFVAGLGVGYQFNNRLALEVAWEYRTNDSSVELLPDLSFSEGDYASNTFFLNGLYYFDSGNRFRPYLGAGLAWVQEVDIDFQQGEQELSYAGDGDVGLQAFAGLDYAVTEHLSLQAELRYTSISGLDLEPEEGASGRIIDIDYQPSTFQLGAVYRF